MARVVVLSSGRDFPDEERFVVTDYVVDECGN